MNIKKIIISAATVAAFVAAGTIAYCTSEKNHEKDVRSTTGFRHVNDQN